MKRDHESEESKLQIWEFSIDSSNSINGHG
jgi:hypothetical protein